MDSIKKAFAQYFTTKKVGSHLMRFFYGQRALDKW